MSKYSLKWILQRVTAVLLIPLTFWFISKCLLFVSMNYDQLLVFFKSKLNSSLFILIMIVMLIHAKIGSETIIDDYIKFGNLKKITKLLINTFIYFSMLIVIISILKIMII